MLAGPAPDGGKASPQSSASGVKIARQSSSPNHGAPAPRAFRRVTHANFRYSVIEGMISNAALGFINPFIAIYGIALGADSFIVSLLTALPAIVNAGSLLVAARVMGTRARKLPAVITFGIISRMFYLPMAFIPYFPGFKPEILVLLICIMSVPGSISVVAWTAMMGDIFPKEKRAEVIGLRNAYVGFTGILATIIAGYFLDAVRFPLNYTLLLTVTWATAMVAMIFMGKMHDVPSQDAEASPDGASGLWEQLTGLFSDPQFGKKFKYFTLSCFMLWFGFGYTAPMWPIYHVSYLHLSNSVIGGLSMVAGLATVLSSHYWGKVGAKKGEQTMLLLSMAGLTIFPAAYMMFPSVPYLMFLQAFAGACTGGLNIAVFNLVLNYARPSYRTSAVAVFNMLLNLASFAAPFLGNLCYAGYGIKTTFISGTCIRFISLMLLWRIMEREFPGKGAMRRIAGVTRKGRDLMRRTMKGTTC